MRLLISFLLAAVALPAQQFGYTVLGRDPGPWGEILSSVGLLPTPVAEAAIVVARPDAPASPAWTARIEDGTILILEGDSALARSFGFQTLARTAKLASLIDTHQPELPLILQQPIELSETSLPAGAQVFTRERWTQVPVSAGLKRGKGGILWLAASPGLHGYERFSFLPNALCDLGFEPPFRGNRLWAFFDYAYRARVDVNWFARRWHASGIAALQVAAWHFYEPDPARDAYLNSLIEACHREGVLVYAWLELPHVSERFWADHAAWREKTALLQDAQLDWRKLMNLADPDCAAAVHRGVGKLAQRFDWDGLNFAELYYESLEGASNPARFTPMNANVRKLFQSQPGGFDPIELWTTRKDAPSLRRFLDFRAGMARALQQEWLAKAETYRALKPDLDIVLTHVDDRLDTGMRDAIGADTANLLPLLEKNRFTFLVEDPATVWNQGPARYPLIASKYPKSSRVAIDINIVERYQDVYPTKQQTGLELFGLVHLASQSFPRVALYIENALSSADLPLLSAAAGEFRSASRNGGKLTVDSSYGGGVHWTGSALVDGKDWPVAESGMIWIPAGSHTLTLSALKHSFSLLSLTGDLLSARYKDDAIELTVTGNSRSIARFNSPVSRVQLDGKPFEIPRNATGLLLPRGPHTVIAWPQADDSGTGHARDSRQAVLSDR